MDRKGERMKDPLGGRGVHNILRFYGVYTNKYTKYLAVWKITSNFAPNNRAMQIVTTREFRANQKKYFELAERETVFVSRKNARPIVISVADDDDFLSKEELLSIQRGLEDIKNGRTYRMQEGESLTDFLKRTEECIK